MSGEGELIAERYRLVSRAGHGGMGVVWHAHDERLGRSVAVKELSSEVCAAGEHGAVPHDPEAAREEAREETTVRAMREGRVAARLRHPHAVTVHDVVTHGRTPCLIMEYLPSRTLSTLLAERGPLAPGEVAGIGAQVASALAAAHAEGIVHRDVKPGNVLVTDDGLAKIADFGISLADGEDAVTAKAGVITGTPAYLAPEVADGGQAGPASDVFSLGATLYLAVEGVPPFGDTGNTIALLVRIAHARPDPPQRAGPLESLLCAMLRRDPARRPMMSEVYDALAAVAGEASVRPAPVLTERTSPLVPRRVPSRAAVTGIVSMVLVATGMVLGAALTAGDSHGHSVAVSSSARCSAESRVTDRWPGGSATEVTVRGDSGGVSGWEVRFSLPTGQVVTDLWNGTLSREGAEVRVTDAGWNAALERGGTTTFGFVMRGIADPAGGAGRQGTGPQENTEVDVVGMSMPTCVVR